MPADLFQEQDDQINIDENKNYLADLVGEGKKFKDQEALAKGKYYSDAYIEIQNKRMDQLRNDYLQLKADYDARAKLEEVLDKLQHGQVSRSQTSNDEPLVKDEKPAINLDDIDSRVSNKLSQLRAEEKAQQNMDKSLSKLKEHYGDKYSSVLKQKSDELGLTNDEVNAMAKRSPELFARTFIDKTSPETFQAPPRTDQRFTPKGAPKRSWSYYQTIKKENPKLYLDPSTQTQMMKDAVELGEAFNDGDFYAM